jgi:VanZ family protein
MPSLKRPRRRTRRGLSVGVASDASARGLSVWLPVVIWAALIFTFSSIPSLNTGLGTWDLLLRKAAHMTEYAILGALLLRALGRELPAFLAGVAYAVTDEVHQYFVEGRPASALDVALDAVGVALGIFLLRLFQTRLGDRRPDMSKGDFHLQNDDVSYETVAERDMTGGQSLGHGP